MAQPPPPPPTAPPPPPPPAPPRPPAPPPPAAPAAAAKGGNRTVIIVICVIVGVLLLIGGCVSTCTYFAAKKAREYTRDARRNPAYASLSLAASLSPDIQVLSKDETSGKITVRNKKTGETVTINTNDYTAENIGRALDKIAQSAQAPAARESAAVQPPATPEPAESEEQPAPAPEPKISAGKAAAMTATLGNFPKYLPAYPGATTVESQLNNIMGMTMGNYAAVTTDKPDDVVGFYEKKLTAAGFAIVGQNNDSNDNGPVRALSATISGPQRTVAITATSEPGGKVRLEVTYAAMSK